jgi:hypothetical protein
MPLLVGAGGGVQEAVRAAGRGREQPQAGDHTAGPGAAQHLRGYSTAGQGTHSWTYIHFTL